MKDISNYIRLTIPQSALNSNNLRDALNKVTDFAGGVTALHGNGGWVNKSSGEVHNEAITQFQWNFGKNIVEPMRALTAEVVDVLFANGEVEVFRERYFFVGSEYTGTLGYVAGILYAPSELRK